MGFLFSSIATKVNIPLIDFFALFAEHCFLEDLYRYLKAGITDLGNAAYQFDDRICRDGFLEIDLAGGDRYHAFTAETGSRNKGYFIHHMHGRTTK